MKYPLCSLLFALAVHSASGIVLFSDTFDAEDTVSFDSASTAGRLSGLVAGETNLRSWGVQQNINNNQLYLPTRTSGGVRFENALNDPIAGANDRYNWAAGAGAAAILGSGGFVVSFDWIPADNTSTDWISFQVGTPNADLNSPNNLSNPQVDYGILFRNNGGTERWDNGTNLGAGGNFTSIAGAAHHVTITYLFNSFDDGAEVRAISAVNGLEVANDTFYWDDNNGELRIELGMLAAQSRIDNFVISTVPEPSAAVVSLCGLASLGWRRRR